jgi:hypothetical protein
MISDLIANIYKKHINPSLIKDEILHSFELEMRILSLINEAKDIKVRVTAGSAIENKVRYYCQNDFIYYEIDSRLKIPTMWINAKFFVFKELEKLRFRDIEVLIHDICKKYLNKLYDTFLVYDFTSDYLMDYNEYLKKYNK